MTDKFIFPDDTVCLFYLQVIENTSDWNLLIRKVQIKIDRWIFSAVLAQKKPQNPAEFGGSKNDFISSFISKSVILDLLISNKNLSNYAKSANSSTQV